VHPTRAHAVRDCGSEYLVRDCSTQELFNRDNRGRCVLGLVVANDWHPKRWVATKAALNAKPGAITIWLGINQSKVNTSLKKLLLRALPQNLHNAWELRVGNDYRLWLDDSGFGSSYFLNRIAQDLAVVKPNGSEDTDITVGNIAGIPLPSNTHLKDQNIDWGIREKVKGERVIGLKKG
jgi:hypothetical protein